MPGYKGGIQTLVREGQLQLNPNPALLKASLLNDRGQGRETVAP
jgi:hypothetical protein